MKIRNGFVSNSSSASFIIKFNSSLSKDRIIEIIKKSDEWLDEKWDKTIREMFNWSQNTPEEESEEIEPLSKTFFGKDGNDYFIKPATTMFNDWMDVPAWQLIRALNEGRIQKTELVENRKTFDGYSECDELVEFDKYCWEYNSAILDPYENMDPNDIPEANEKQNDIEYEYLNYLSKIDVPLTENEIQYLAKQHLNNN